MGYLEFVVVLFLNILEKTSEYFLLVSNFRNSLYGFHVGKCIEMLFMVQILVWPTLLRWICILLLLTGMFCECQMGLSNWLTIFSRYSISLMIPVLCSINFWEKNVKSSLFSILKIYFSICLISFSMYFETIIQCICVRWLCLFDDSPSIFMNWHFFSASGNIIICETDIFDIYLVM